MSDMMHTGLAHVWATQENSKICLKKLSGTERAAWQETRRRQLADNEPREFFIYTMERRIPEPAGEGLPASRLPELTVLMQAAKPVVVGPDSGGKCPVRTCHEEHGLGRCSKFQRCDKTHRYWACMQYQWCLSCLSECDMAVRSG
jgi:hypothetical protein